MKTNTVLYFILSLLFAGIQGSLGAPDEQKPSEVITCKPQFDLRERSEIHVTDAQGNDRTAFHQWLILDNGKQKFRIPWGSPPLSRGPVDLSSHETYTFTLEIDTNSKTPVHKVLRIIKGNEVVYDATKMKKTSDKSEQSK